MKKFTELVMILDRSGSMQGLERDTIGGYNSLIQKQRREEGQALVTTVLFDDRVETLQDRVLLSDVPEMTEKEYYVRGCTALLDAVGCTVSHIRGCQGRMRPEDRPEKTLVVITTDGLENASREYTCSSLKRMIREQEEAGWEFLFLGANMDAVKVGGSFGIRPDHAASYCCDEAGTALNYDVISEAVSRVRTQAAPLSADWKSRIDRDFSGRQDGECRGNKK